MIERGRIGMTLSRHDSAIPPAVLARATEVIQ